MLTNIDSKQVVSTCGDLIIRCFGPLYYEHHHLSKMEINTSLKKLKKTLKIGKKICFNW